MIGNSVNLPTYNPAPRLTRVIVGGNPSDPGAAIIDASDGFIAILRDAGYIVTPL